MAEFTITIKGTEAFLEGELSGREERWLRDTFCWAPILELPKICFFYENKKMFAGAAYFVKGALEKLGHTADIVVKEPAQQFTKTVRFLGEYRSKQREAIDAILQSKRGIVFASPGFGKSLVATVAACESGCRALIVVQAKEPLDQFVDSLRKFTDYEQLHKVGIFGDGNKSFERVTIATVQALNNAIKRKDQEVLDWLRQVEFVAVDECHHAAADSYLKLYQNLGDVSYLIGMSATPFRNDDKGILLHVMFGPIIFDMGYTEMVESDILCPLKIFIQKVPKSERQAVVPKNKFHARSLYQKVYQEYIVENEARNRMAVEFARKLNEKGHTCAIIVSRLDHADNLQRLLPYAVVVHGKTPKKEREGTIQALRNHQIRTVISTLFDEAVDVASLGGVALMAGGKSEVKLIQRLRSTRTFDGTLYDGRNYKKEKGFVFYPEDDAPMLAKHSKQNIKELEKLAKSTEHIEVVRV